MLRLKIVLLTAVITCTQWVAFAEDADAGFLRDWINRRRCRRSVRLAQSCPKQCPTAACPTAACPTTACATPAAPAASYAGLQPGQCMKTCQQTCSRVVVNYVPCTSYRTTCEKVPVTQYRPQTKSDPCTGCTVTCMRPCTTYTYRTRRVPYTTYRPVYRTETYRVPVTTITNDCNTCATPGAACGTCNVGGSVVGAQAYGLPVQQQIVPGGTITTQGTYGLQPSIPGATVTPLPTPANTTPGINPQNSNRSMIDGMEGSSTRMNFPRQDASRFTLTSTNPIQINRDWSDVPVVSVADKSPVTRKWSYSPVKQASYTSVGDVEQTQIKTIRGKFNSIETSKVEESKPSAAVNSGWKTVEW